MIGVRQLVWASFFAFWLSHVPESRFRALWNMLGDALSPTGRFFFIDERLTESARKSERSLGRGVIQRQVHDGRTFRAVKIYHRPATLERRLRDMGWEAEVRPCGPAFYFGRGQRQTTTWMTRHELDSCV